jgi:hypothetical protein
MEHAPVAEPSTADAPAAPTGCPVDHLALAAAAAEVAGCPVPHAGPAVPPADEAARCPVPHVAAASACPIDLTNRHRTPVRRTKADLVVRRVLRIPDRPDGASQREVYAAFQKSMLISATRCTLTYVVFPFVLPAIGLALTGLIGVIVGLLAMVADVFTIRRFFAVDHKWRWQFSTVVFGIMCLLTALLVQDISHLAT